MARALAESAEERPRVRTTKASPIDPYALSQAILDPTNLKILASLSRKPMTAKQLVKVVSVPYTTCYRRLNWLVKNELCKMTTHRTREGNLAFKVYSAEIESLTLHFDEDDLSLNLKLSSLSGKNLKYHQWLG